MGSKAVGDLKVKLALSERLWPTVRALVLQALDWSGWAAYIPIIIVLGITSRVAGWPGIAADGKHLLITSEVRVWVMLIGQLTGLSIFIFAWKVIERKGLRDMLLDHSLNCWRPLIRGFSMGGGGIALVVLGMMASGCVRLTLQRISISPHSMLTAVGLLISSAFLGPFVEEIGSRGYIFQNTSRGWGTVPATVITAVVFAARHVQNPNVSVLGILNIALISILLTLGMLRLRSLWYAIGWHIAWNFSMLFVFGVANSGYSLQAFDVAGASVFSPTFSGANWLTGGGFGLEGSFITTVVVLLQILAVWGDMSGAS